MQIQELLNKASLGGFLSAEEGVFLFENASTTELMFTANEITLQLLKNTNKK